MDCCLPHAINNFARVSLLSFRFAQHTLLMLSSAMNQLEYKQVKDAGHASPIFIFTAVHYYKRLSRYILLYNMLSKGIWNEKWPEETSLQIPPLQWFKWFLSTCQPPSKVTFSQLGLKSCLPYHIGSCSSQNQSLILPKLALHLGSPTAARRPDARRHLAGLILVG